MVNKHKQKGDRYEREVLSYLRNWGFGWFTRTRAGRREDEGDIHGDDQVAYEIRNRKHIDLAANIDDAYRHAEVGGKPMGVAIMKRRNKPVGQSYVVMTLKDFCRLRGLVYLLSEGRNAE